MNIDQILQGNEQISIYKDLTGKFTNQNLNESISYVKIQARKIYSDFKNNIFMASGYSGKCGFETIPNTNELVPTGISHKGKIIQDEVKYKAHLDQSIISFAKVEQYTDLLEEYLGGSVSEILYLKAMSLHWLHPHKDVIEKESLHDPKYKIVDAMLNPGHIVGALNAVKTAYISELSSDLSIEKMDTSVAKNMLNEIDNAIGVYQKRQPNRVYQKGN